MRVYSARSCVNLVIACVVIVLPLIWTAKKAILTDVGCWDPSNNVKPAQRERGAGDSLNTVSLTGDDNADQIIRQKLNQIKGSKQSKKQRHINAGLQQSPIQKENVKSQGEI